jgi:hypothetical protein
MTKTRSVTVPRHALACGCPDVLAATTTITAGKKAEVLRLHGLDAGGTR